MNPTSRRHTLEPWLSWEAGLFPVCPALQVLLRSFSFSVCTRL